MDINKKTMDKNFEGLLTTEKVNEIMEKQKMNLKISQNEKIWFNKEIGIRKADLNFAMTSDELDEYTKCKLDIHYFADKYCHIKREDGTIGPMVLRDYQKDIIDLYSENRYSILMASRQTGKCNSLISKVLIKDTRTGEVYETTLGELYYRYIKMERDLTILEKIKLYLYHMLSRL